MSKATTMTRDEAIERLADASEDEDLADEAAALFAAIYGRKPVAYDGDAGELISLCYADPDVAAACRNAESSGLDWGDHVDPRDQLEET